MSRIAEERETVITFNDEQGEALVWSASPAFHRKMVRLGVEPYKTADDGHWYKVPKTWIKVRPPTHRQLSDEQRAALSERARQNLARHVIGSSDTVIA